MKALVTPVITSSRFFPSVLPQKSTGSCASCWRSQMVRRSGKTPHPAAHPAKGRIGLRPVVKRDPDGFVEVDMVSEGIISYHQGQVSSAGREPR